MNKYFNGIIVVEGKEDVAFLSSFIYSIYVTTRGHVIPEKEIDFLNNAGGKKVVILTDSDEAGETIRERLNNVVINPINIKLDLAKCNRNNKHGVAEATKEEVLNKLSPLFSAKDDKGELTLSDLVKLGINDKETREFISQELHLGLCNYKTMIKRMNFKGITANEIKSLMEKHDGNK